ncbi:Threonine aldolase protein [Rutstroemia sp. NJR-2017a WRK4]|nr:Threonine aldolase protein [Rutstroemia sp. NJR-2017a WRK4]
MAPALEVQEDSSLTEMQRPGESVTAWQQPGPAAVDFRKPIKGDITTTSTPAMLAAIAKAGINDGWTASGALEHEALFSKLCGRESALFMISSTMSNQIALRAHLTQPPVGVIVDERSHILHQEAGGMSILSGALPQTVRPSNGLYMRLEDIKRKVVISDGSDACTTPTRLIHIENPLGGLIMPLKELRRIKDWASENNIKVHVDGSRLWEAVVVGAGSLVDFCQATDSMNLCLTKGIGAPVGSVLIGDKEFIRIARWNRKSVGGAMRQPGIVSTMAWAAVVEAFGQDPNGKNSLLHINSVHAARIASLWQELGGKLLVPQQTNMIWLDLAVAGISEDEWERLAALRGLHVHSTRLVFHYLEVLLTYQTEQSDQAIEELEEHIRSVMSGTVREPLIEDVPRNDVGSRLTISMQETLQLASFGVY